MARSLGWKSSQLIEKAMIDLVNSAHETPVVDAIGRYIDEKKR